MFHLMAGPVLLTAHAAAVVVGQHTGPHQVCPGGVIIGIGQGLRSGVHNGFHQRLAQPVRQGHIRRVGEIPLADMGKHIHGAAGGLIRRKGAGEAGVQHGELGADHIAFRAAPLQISLLLGDDAAVRPLTAGGRDRQHDAHRKRSGNDGLSGEEVPEVPVVGHTKADGLCGVDDAAAAQRQKKVTALLTAEVNALVYLAAAGIGLDAGELRPGKAGLPQRGGHGVIGAVALDGAAAGDQQYPGSAKAAHQGAGVFLFSVAEDEERGGVEREVVHGKAPF